MGTCGGRGEEDEEGGGVEEEEEEDAVEVGDLLAGGVGLGLLEGETLRMSSSSSPL